MSLNVTAIIALLIIVVLSIVGVCRGFVMAVYNLGSVMIVFALAFALRSVATALLSKCEPVVSFIYGHVESALDLPALSRDEMISLIQSKSLPDAIKNLIIKLLDSFLSDAELTINSFRSAIYLKVTDILLGILGFLAALLFSFIVVNLVFKFLDFIAQLPVLHKINKIGGLLVGFLEGVLTVWIACGIISVISFMGFVQPMVDDIHESKALSFMYDHSIIAEALSGEFMDTLSEIGDLDNIKDRLQDLGESGISDLTGETVSAE